ncbi:RNA-guided endonuclease InsQ/TnpB family protein [Natronosalvus halobius]|uniref:RNA-guided endonuclease InsQ/TnpB family protein n=1 Tax=Natronosalvus halobius TaxID=2953746 RepID=UPI00209CF1A7|nr:transposase [Natronosalvus halobius]USZ73517.1 transposase [Natronosalvus halobius]
MEPTVKYRAHPETEEDKESALYQINLNREVYNHALTQYYNPAPEHDKPTYTTLQNKLPEWKGEFPKWVEAHSKALQMAVRRIYWARDALDELETRGHNVGGLTWKRPHDFRSVTYNQSGFDVDSNTGRDGHATLELSKIGTFDIEYHRPLPDDANIKQVILKQEKSGKWFVSIVLDTEPEYPEPPEPSTIDVEDTVGIDLGILAFTHDSDGIAVTPPEFSEDIKRIDKRHRELSGKDHGSNNWEKARRRLAEAYEDLRNKFKDFREKLARAYTRDFDAVFLEDLNTRGLLRLSSNGRNIALMSWYETIQTFKRHGRKNGCHVITVPPEGTTKRCAKCSVETAKPLWVREHSCPACGFEADRDRNAAFEVQKLGLKELGVDYSLDVLLGLGESESTPAETATAVDTREVSASRVVETGSLPSRNAGRPASPHAG